MPNHWNAQLNSEEYLLFCNRLEPRIKYFSLIFIVTKIISLDGNRLYYSASSWYKEYYSLLYHGESPLQKLFYPVKGYVMSSSYTNRSLGVWYVILHWWVFYGDSLCRVYLSLIYFGRVRQNPDSGTKRKWLEKMVIFWISTFSLQLLTRRSTLSPKKYWNCLFLRDWILFKNPRFPVLSDSDL